MSADLFATLGATLGANPAARTALVVLATLAAFTLDRWLRHWGRRIERERAQGAGADLSAFLAGALSAGQPLFGLLRIGVWLALAWIAGEISPSLRYVRTIITVVGHTAITAPAFMLNERGYSILDVIELPIAVMIAWLAVKYAIRFLDSRLTQSGRFDTGTRDTIALLGRCILGFSAALIVLHAWGVDMSSLTIAASVIGVGVGFGLQNITSNFVSGVLVSLERPIRPGDFVKVGDLRGTVQRIGLRCTEIVTLDRVTILVPNSHFLEKEVVNWTHGDPVYRLHVPIGVAYGSDTAAVREALLGAAQSHRAVLRDPTPRVDFRGFGASALEFELLVWARDPKQQALLLSDLNYRIEASLRECAITIAPQLDVLLHTARGDVRSDAARDGAAANGGGPTADSASAEPPQAQAERPLAASRDALGQARRPVAASRDALAEGGRPGPASPDALAQAGRRSPDALAGTFDEACDTRAWTEAEIDALLERMRGAQGVPVADRRHRLRVYRRCFVGREAVDWIVRTVKVNREEALEIGSVLFARGAFHHVLHEHALKDGNFFYRFRGDENFAKAAAPPR